MVLEFDQFGILKLHPTKTGGLEWFNNWGNGVEREFDEGSFDPEDSRLKYLNGSPSEVHLHIDGNGEAFTEDTCTSIRLFITGPWTNTEMTVYVKKTNTLSGMSMRSRSNHQNTCGFGNYEVAWSDSDKLAAVEVEVIHPIYKRNLAEVPFTTGFPLNEWVGFKQITKTVGDKVLVQGWVNYSITNQNTWVRTTQFWFDGRNIIMDHTGIVDDIQACLGLGDNIFADLRASTRFLNAGNWCWSRFNDTDDIRLKFYSVREIDAG